VDTTLVSLVPSFSNVHIRLVDGETAGSDTCTFHRTLLEQVLGMSTMYEALAESKGRSLYGTSANATLGCISGCMIVMAEPCESMVRQGLDLFDRYTHFALINNGMRGPFVAADDTAVEQHWAAPFIGLLSREVKLAGNYLSCEVGVHLQGPFLITDRCALPTAARRHLAACR
jgi:hypothetical protein